MNPGAGGWNSDTNIFTCPMDGYYLFMVTLYKYDGSSLYNIYAMLRMSDGKYGVRLNNYHYDSASVYFSSTMQAIVPCAVGETVWVAITTSGGGRIHDDSSHYNQFSGLLIKEGLE